MHTVYLDQCHVSPKAAEPDLARLRTLANDGKICCPVSLVHFLETSQDRPDRRHATRNKLLALSNGRVLLNELSVSRLELEAARAGHAHGWVRARVLSTNAWDLVVPVRKGMLWRASRLVPFTLEQVFRWSHPVTDSRRILEKVRKELSAGASAANDARREQTLPSWDQVLDAFGAADLAERLDPATRSATFRAVASRRALQEEIWRSRARGLDPNDLNDTLFLSVALPYLDAVCIDRAMYARVEEGRKSVGIPWARAFRERSELISWLEAAA